MSERRTGRVLASRIDAITWPDALTRILGWARAGESRTVAVCNVQWWLKRAVTRRTPR